jgi:hypothetical protein
MMGPRFADRRREGHAQGFLTSTGRFVDREEAKHIARATGQYRHREGRSADWHELYSEDVW